MKKAPCKRKKVAAPKSAKPSRVSLAKIRKAEDARRERFCLEYMVDYNGAQAYMRSGYEVKDADVAASAASRMLRDDRVSQRIAVLEAEAFEALGINKFRVLRERSRIAHVDPAKIFDENGDILPIPQIDPDTRAAISSVKTVTTRRGRGEDAAVEVSREIKFWDKNAAGSDLMKHRGLFEEDNAQKTDPVRALLEAIDGKSTGLPAQVR